MTTLSYRAILFDLDGTLVDSIHDIAAAANAMLVQLGFQPLNQDLIATFVGKGIDALIWQCLLEVVAEDSPSPELYQQGRAAFAQAYQKQLATAQTALYPKVRTGLQAFQDSGAQLAIVTNKPLANTQVILKQTGLDSFFTEVVGGDSCEEKKPHPLPLLYACAQMNVEPAQALMIGDSINDVQAARAAGIDVLVLPYGYNQGRPVSELEANAIVPSIEDAFAWALDRTRHAHEATGASQTQQSD